MLLVSLNTGLQRNLGIFDKASREPFQHDVSVILSNHHIQQINYTTWYFPSLIQMASSYNFRMWLDMIHWHFKDTVATVAQKKLKENASNCCVLKIHHLSSDKSLCNWQGPYRMEFWQTGSERCTWDIQPNYLSGNWAATGMPVHQGLEACLVCVNQHGSEQNDRTQCWKSWKLWVRTAEEHWQHSTPY